MDLKELIFGAPNTMKISSNAAKCELTNKLPCNSDSNKLQFISRVDYFNKMRNFYSKNDVKKWRACSSWEVWTFHSYTVKKCLVDVFPT